MLRVLAKIAMIVAILGGTLLAGESSAQSARPRRPIRQAAYQDSTPEAEEVPPGASAAIESSPSEVFEDEGQFADEEPESLLGNLGWFRGPESLLPFGFPGLDPEAEALIPEGTWFNRGPLWYTSVAATMIQKSAPTHQATGLPIATRLFEALTTSGIAFTQPLVMSTSALDAHFTPGMRITIGRNLYEDIFHRQHALEFSFLGLNTWDSRADAIGQPGKSTQTTVLFDNLWSNFPFRTQTGFNNATEMRIKDTSSFSNFEINYRISKLPRADRVAQTPGGKWMQVGTTSLVHSFLFGVRAFTFNDDFHWLSVGAHTNGETFSGTYDVKTTNALVGAQIGGDVFWNANKWSLGIRSKAGIYGNLASQASFVQIVDPSFQSSSGAGKATVGTSAFIGDLGFIGTTRLSERVYFRAAYDFMWVGGIANAAEQLQYTTNIAPVVRKNGHLLFQGVSLGFDFAF